MLPRKDIVKMGKQWKKAGKQEQASKKGALFTKLSREIQVAVRLGGPSPSNNPRLKLALETARTHSLPKDTISKAIAKGTASPKEGENIEEVLYEGFGPHGTAFLVSCLTNNRVRTVSEIRYLFKKHKGNMGESGSAMWMFKKTDRTYQAKHPITLNNTQAKEVSALWQELKNHLDCQSVWTNIPPSPSPSPLNHLKHKKNKRNNKGLALVMALSLIVVVILLAQETVFDTQIEYRSAIDNFNRLKAYYLAKAGMEINILRVKTYVQLSQSHGQRSEMQALIPYMNLIWQFPFGWPPHVLKEASPIVKQELNKLIKESLIKEHFITSIQPENSRIDVNDLGSPIPSLRTWTFEVLHRLIMILRLENPHLSENLDEQEVTTILNNIQDWVDPNTLQADTTISEKDLYEPEGLPPNRSFVSPQELLQVAGMTPALYQALLPFITTYGEKGININTAPAKLLHALHEDFPLDLAKDIVALRFRTSQPPVFWTESTFEQFLIKNGFDILNQQLQNKQSEEPTRDENQRPKVSYIFFETPHNFKISSTAWAGESQRTLTASYFDTAFTAHRVSKLMQEEVKREKIYIGNKIATAQIPTSTQPIEQKPAQPSPKAKKEEPTIIYWKESL